jgi:hypothetical protein
MSQKLRAKIEKLSQDNLVDIICAVHDTGKHEKSLIEQFVAAYNPKDLYTILNKQITSIKSSKRFIDYHESHGMACKIHRINSGVDRSLVKQSPELAIKLCKKLIEIDSSIFERADDSNGDISESYYDTYEILDEAFYHSDLPVEQIAEYLFDIYTHDDYGVRSHILNYFNKSLKKGVDKRLEELVLTNKLDRYMKVHALKVIADVRNDVEYYIRIAKEYNEEDKSKIPDNEICDVARRLNKAFRGDEAIELLKNLDFNEYHYSKGANLLIEAYKLNGEDDKAQKVLWKRFESLLLSQDYLEYIKLSSEEERKIALAKAIELTKAQDNIAVSLQFLYNIQEYDLIENLIFENTKQLNAYDYSLYRKLSTDLAKNGKYLAATLLRRELVNNVLTKAISKYYKYAVSDLKKAREFSFKVTDWHNFDDHAGFMEVIEENHKRKTAFWHKVNEMILTAS